MVRVLIDQRVSAWVGIDCMRPDVMGTRELVPQMAVDCVNEEQFTILIPIMAPRVGRATAQHLHHFPLRMISPDRAAQRNPIFRTRPWNTDLPWTGRAAAPVQPAVRPEFQAVGKGMIVVRGNGE